MTANASRTILIAAASLLALGAAPSHRDTRWQLSLPLECKVGETCFIQNYVDADPGPEAHDYQCGWRTYDAHNGTDFRLPSMVAQRAGVNVVAVLRGKVLRVRDGVADVSVRARGADAVKGSECGNGLVIDHGGGWESQYCHMAKGSIAVRPGQRVRTGQPLGRVGLSGNTEFPHLHLIIRRDGQLVDPFAYGAPAGSCGLGHSLWARRLSYQAGEILQTGFATTPVSLADAQEQGALQQPRPTRDGPALVAFVQSIGLHAGDVQRLRLRAPGGALIAEGAAPALAHDQAQSIWAVGRKTPPGGWKPGIYQAEFAVKRDGVDRIVRNFRIVL